MKDNNPVMDAIGRLAGYQAICIHEAYRVLLSCDGDPDLMPVAVRRNLCKLLAAHGYRETWVTEKHSDEARLMWVRDPWPIDVAALADKELESYTLA